MATQRFSVKYVWGQRKWTLYGGKRVIDRHSRLEELRKRIETFAIRHYAEFEEVTQVRIHRGDGSSYVVTYPQSQTQRETYS